MIGYYVPVTCPACGGDLDHVADGKPNRLGTEVAAHAVCTNRKCRRGWIVHVWLALAEPSRGITGSTAA